MNYLTPRELGAEIRKDPASLRRWRQRGIGPTWLQLGSTVLYPVDAVNAWIAANTHQPRSVQATGTSEAV